LAQTIIGVLNGLNHEPSVPVSYQLSLDGHTIGLNTYLSTHLTMAHTGRKFCVACGRSVNKLYQNGYCFPCVQTLAECDLCIVKPEICHHHLGTCRDNAYADTHCFIPHYVYLSYTSSVKVGVTRAGRELTRWVDQGAMAAVLLAKTQTRRNAGIIEHSLTTAIADKTNWRGMLKSREADYAELEKMRHYALERISTEMSEYGMALPESPVHTFTYPSAEYSLEKVFSLSLDKNPGPEGTLVGLKGQYLIFDSGVFNLKKFSGYEVTLTL
jgi:hypothetical protein